ncbi:MAG: DNA/RNA nuclease SfsA [Lachnospiraceae bacterium]|nr:DNA/RNA nuclease SfsA [Lachnospiraceae bacterium]
MRYRKIVTATFLRRNNRFVAEVLLNGKKETVHVKNTGRCGELLLEGVRVILAEADNPARKTRYDLIAVYRKYEDGKELLFNIDSQAPNQVVREWLERQQPFGEILKLRPEYTYGQSRLDFMMELRDGTRWLLEVKGVTLEREGRAWFPDAPTIRGIKHIHELIHATEEDWKTGLLFVLQMEGVQQVSPNRKTHEEFAVALAEARQAGVELLCMGCAVTEDSLEIERQGEVILEEGDRWEQ